MDPAPTPHPDHLRRGVGSKPSWEYFVTAGLAVFFIWFGYHVLHRSAFADRRKTDAGVFFRAGWAVRTGADPYTVEDNNHFYYIYPPLFAVLMSPLADAPKDLPRDGLLPYPVSIVIWYGISALCAFASVHLLARTLERGSPDPAVAGIRPTHAGWWNLRLWPLLACMPDIGSTLSKGQVNLFILLIISLGVYAIGRSRRLTGGVVMALAACIKVFPAVLVWYPLSRLDWRALGGWIVGGLIGLAVIPAVALGPSRAWDYTREFGEHTLLPALGLVEEKSRQSGSEFSDTDNQSIQGSLHNLLNITTIRTERPDKPQAWVPLVHGAVSIGLLGATLLIGRRGGGARAGPESALVMVLRVGMLCCIMVLAVPMCHRHYYAFLLPAIMALTFGNIQTSTLGTLRGHAWWLLPAYGLALAVPKIWDKCMLIRDLPIAPIVTFVVWGLSARALIRFAPRGTA